MEVSRTSRIRTLIRGGALLLVCASLASPFPLRFEIASVRFYRAHLSHYVGYVATCRYRPTCSLYALQRLESDGFWLGNLRITQRLAMCSPLGFAIDSIRGKKTEWESGEAYNATSTPAAEPLPASPR